MHGQKNIKVCEYSQGFRLINKTGTVLIKVTMALRKSGTDYPVTWCHTAEGRKLQENTVLITIIL